jgi:hypothetical protein
MRVQGTLNNVRTYEKKRNVLLALRANEARPLDLLFAAVLLETLVVVDLAADEVLLEVAVDDPGRLRALGAYSGVTAVSRW